MAKRRSKSWPPRLRPTNRTRYTHDGESSLVELREEWDFESGAFVPVDRYTYEYVDGRPGVV
ncbi:MAG: hypothetical protein WED81_04500, partial [Rhodothermales bacterium]